MTICWLRFRSFLGRIVFPPGVNHVSPVLLLIFFLTSFGNSMALTMPFSFMPRLMKTFGVKENEVGYYVGITASSLYIGRTFASYFWGWLCDRIGSRKGLLITTALIIVTTFAFGLSNSVAWAVATRLLQGLVGGLIITLKAAVFCICDETNSSVGFSIVLGAYSCGLIAGPAIGGFIVFPVEKFPGVFSKGSFFGRFPILLPNLVVVCILAISLILIYFYIPETLIKRKLNEKSRLLDSTQSNGSIKEDSDTKREETRFIVSTKASFIDSESFLLVSMKRTSQSCSDEFVDDSKENGSISCYQFPETNNRKLDCFSSCCTKFRESNFSILIRRRSVLLSLSLFGLVAFANIAFDQLFPIFADSSHKFGGLNFATDQIGTANLIDTIPIIILTFLMAQVERRLGAKRLNLIVQNFPAFVLPLFPYIGALDRSKIWYVLIPILLLMRTVISFSFFAANVFLNNSVEPKYAGSINGLGTTVACLFRMMSPITFGGLYSWTMKHEGTMGYPFNHFLPFVACAFVSLIILFLTSLLPKDDIRKLELEETEDSCEKV